MDSRRPIILYSKKLVTMELVGCGIPMVTRLLALKIRLIGYNKLVQLSLLPMQMELGIMGSVEALPIKSECIFCWISEMGKSCTTSSC